MIEKMGSSVLGLSLAAGVFILIVAVLRRLFCRAPHRVFVFLWLLVGLRLLVPVSIESPLSVRGLVGQWRVEQAAEREQPTAPETPGSSEVVRPSAEGVPQAADAVPSGAGKPSEPTKEMPKVSPGGQDYAEPVGQKPGAIGVMSVLWLCGAALVLAYGATRYLDLRFRLRDAVWLSDNVWQSDRIDTPFLFGVIRPRIYVPFGIEEKLPYVLAHERTHRRNGDHIIKALWFVLLALYWFHPLVWLAYGLLGRDMELACDERVILGMNGQEKSAYAQALLEISIDKKPLALSPLAFGEVGVKMRILHVLSYKKPAIFGALTCLGIGVVFAALLLTDPQSSNAQQGEDSVQGETNGRGDAGGIGGQKDPANGGKPAGTDLAGRQVSLGGRTVGGLAFDTEYLADLDGDGRMEQFYATLAADGYLALVLTSEAGETQTGLYRVDGYGIESSGAAAGLTNAASLGDVLVMNPETEQFYILDVDKNDSFLELAFLEYGPSDDWETQLVRLADGKLQHIGSFTGSPEGRDTVIAGDGTIKAPTRFDLIQTSWALVSWRLRNGRLEYEEPLEGEFLRAVEQYQSDRPVVAARDFAAWMQDKASSAAALVPKGTKLCIQRFRRIGSYVEDNVDQNSYEINFYYMDEHGDRIEASVFLESPFGQIYMVNESVDSPMELFDGLSMAG